MRCFQIIQTQTKNGKSNGKALVEQLKNDGATIVDKIEVSGYGKFVRAW